MEKAIIVENITKKYKLYNDSKERIFDLITPKSYGQDFYALSNVTFEADKGDVIGFIGINGSGKSTLSNIVAGIVPETSGYIEVNGQASLIAVSSGLKGDLTGRDNIELKCLMLGFTKEEINELEPDIIDFSELGNFIDQPVKSYSSGMKSRLGFAISVNVDPDILIIDEALSVGDKAFAEKSLAKMREFKEQGKTMIFVSHSIGQMKKFCEKILWLEYGSVREYGSVDTVIPKYEEFLSQWKKMSKKDRETYKYHVMAGDISTYLTADQEETVVDSLKYKQETNYTTELTSKLCHIKAGKSYIYPKLLHSERKSSEEYKDSVYYIKKQATYRGELFYLLSNQPSFAKGIIGWMKALEVSSHVYLEIDTDPKLFYIKGTVLAFTRPWGGKKNLVFDDLKLMESSEFNVIKTVKVGNNVWYCGVLNEQQMWVHQSQLKDSSEVS